MEQLQKLDEYFFRIINSAGWDGMDGIMMLISSKWFWIPLYIYIIYLIYKQFSNQFLKILFALGLLIFIADFGSQNLFKEQIERPRPCNLDSGLDPSPRLWTNKKPCDGNGFISGHASNAFALAFFCGLIFRNRWMFSLLFSWAVLIGFSRVYLGVHYPFDILGGMFWGLFVSLLVYYIYRMNIKDFNFLWFVWLALVCVWNFVWPLVPPIADVLVAVVLSLGLITIKKRKR